MRAFAVLVASLVFSIAQWLSASASENARETAFRENFYAVHVIDYQAWIVGYYGTILYSPDRGETWQIQRSPATHALFTVRFADRDKGWITGSYGTILTTDNGGKSWRAQNSGTSEHLFGLALLDRNHGWAVGSRGTTIHTVNGGEPWTPSLVSDDFTFSGVSFIDSARGWMAGEFGVIFHTIDGGKSWIKQKSPIEVSFASGESRNLFALQFSRADSGYAVGLDGLVLQTKPGEGWKIIRQGATAGKSTGANHLFALTTTDEQLWVAGERGSLLHADRDGKQWRALKTGIPRVSLNGIAFGKNGFGLTVGNRGVVLRTGDGGATWKQLKLASAPQPIDPVRVP